MSKSDERYPIRCRDCGNVLAVREGNYVVTVMKYRSRKKELHIRLYAEQKMTILCDRCGTINEIIGS